MRIHERPPVEIETLKLGSIVWVRHFNQWYRARVFSIGRSRVTVVFHLHRPGSGDRRRDVRASELRPVQPEDLSA